MDAFCGRLELQRRNDSPILKKPSGFYFSCFLQQKQLRSPFCSIRVGSALTNRATIYLPEVERHLFLTCASCCLTIVGLSLSTTQGPQRRSPCSKSLALFSSPFILNGLVLVHRNDDISLFAP